MSKLLTGKTTYNPSEEYYFLDYKCKIETRWVRSPYMTIEEVQECISNHHGKKQIKQNKDLSLIRALEQIVSGQITH